MKPSSSNQSANPLAAFSDALAGAVTAASRSVVAVNARRRIPSSGVLWRAGVVVTAEHTLKRDEEISVTLADNRTVPATLAGRDPGSDVGVLRIDLPGESGAEFADAASLQVGDMALALGRRGENGVSASLGIISALSGAWRTWRGGQLDQFIRPDISLYPGSSGGPLIDVHGRVIGMNTSALTRNAGVTIPAATIERVASELLAKGHISRGYLGVGLHPVQISGGNGGLIVLSVEATAPAGSAGVIIGDVLTALDGKPVQDTDDVQSHLGPDRVGKSVKASILRGGNAIELTITPGNGPEEAADMAHGSTALSALPFLATHLRRSSVEISGPWRGGGSGVIWNSEGLIVTNAHVLRGPRAQVTLSDGRTFEGEVVARNPRRDLAALRIPGRGLPAADFGDSSRLRVGQIVAAIGNPFGVAGALSIGIIHAIGEANWIQADVRLAPGNSGGMLADASGRVIGINTMIAGGLALAVPSNAVERFLSAHTGAAAA